MPWTATVDFYFYMAKQTLLYDLKQYGLDQLKLSSDNTVIQVIATAINNIDWAAIKYAFRITPFGIILTIWSGAKKGAELFGISSGEKHNAQALIDIADEIHNNTRYKDGDVRLALIAIFHLIGHDTMAFLKIMTQRHKDAISKLAGKISA